MNQYKLKLLCVSALVAPWALTTPAIAQSNAPPGHTGDEVIVTAQKRAENIEKVPMSMTAVSGSTLQKRGFTQPSDLQFIVPSMQANHLRGYTGITIRGVGYNNVGTSGVAVHVDGVYQPRPAMGDLAQIDVQRVEVLRGPQGTLYGRNANGGVINYITQTPTNKFEGYVFGSYSSYDESRLQAVVNIPVTDKVRTRFVIDDWQRNQGFIKNVIPGAQDLDKGRSLGGRFNVAIDLTNNLTVDVIGTVFSRSGPFVYFTLANTPKPAWMAAFPSAIITTQPWRTSATAPSNSIRNYDALTGIVNWRLGNWNLKSTTGYQYFLNDFTADYDATNIATSNATSNILGKTWTQEFDFSGTVGPVDAVLGAFYMDDNAPNLFQFIGPAGFGPGSPLAVPNSEVHNQTLVYDTKVYAGFGNFTWHVTDKFNVVGGIRYSAEHQTIVQTNLSLIGGTIPLGAPCTLQRHDVSFDSATPRLGVQYNLNDDNNFYATYSQGYKAGGFNNQSGCGAEYKPEQISSYEIGWKTRLFDRRLSLSLDAFYYDYKNFQVNEIMPTATVIANAPAASVAGAELELAYRPDQHWTVSWTSAYLDGIFLDFHNIDDLNTVAGLQSVAGHYLPNTPKFSDNVSVSYLTDPVIAGGTLLFEGHVSYRSRVYFREFNALADSQAPYGLIGLSATWTSPNNRYSLRVFGENLSDTAYYTNMFDSSGEGIRGVEWNDPRQAGVSLKVNF